MPASSDLIEIGRISGIYGVRGWVRVFSYTQPRSNIFNYSPWILKSAEGQQIYTLNQGRKHGKTLVAQLEGITDRESARTLLNIPVFVERDQLPPSEEGKFYWHDLYDLVVFNTENILLGQVSHLVETGANDVMVVRDHNNERLIPFILGDVVMKVDLQQKQIIVDWDPDF
ncbi:MAG: ribosome maturation factor RimM [Gammaproteobacteria bacterium]|nr:MAG: ribosome maturation factor RimM [Gammaproteobacteria bacterium]